MSSRSATYTWLKQHIANLPREQGVFLTEIDVAAKAGTSRTPVREAFMRLESEGLLELIPRRGAYVPPVSNSEIETMMQAREMVEDWSVRQLITNPSKELVEELHELVDQQEESVEDPVTFIDLDRAFRTHLVWGAGNEAVARFCESLRDRQLRMGIYAVTADVDRSRSVVDEHRKIVESIAEGSSDAASQQMSSHLEKTLSAMLTAPRPRGGDR